MTIQVYYSCPQCGLVQVTCEVTAREDEDLETWMNQTMITISNDHTRRSPRCQSNGVTNLIIPVVQNKVGGVTVQ